MIKYLRQFENPMQLIEYAEPIARGSNSSVQGTPAFTGTKSREEAFYQFSFGHAPGRELMQKLLAELTASIQLPSIQYEFQSALEGCAPNVEAFLLGQPDDMFEIVPIECDAPPSVLNVQLEMCFSCLHSEEVAALSGAIVYAAMEGLRLQGCAVAMSICYTVRDFNRSDKAWQLSFPINSNTDIDTVSFILTHPSMLRRIIFAAMEQEDTSIRNIFGFNAEGYSVGYGHPSTLKQLHSDIMLSIPAISNEIGYTTEKERMNKAKEIFQTLVDSKFTKIVK